MTQTLDLNEPGLDLKRAILEAIQRGDEIVLAADGANIVRVMPSGMDQKPDRSKALGYWSGTYRMANDFNTMSDEELDLWYK